MAAPLRVWIMSSVVSLAASGAGVQQAAVVRQALAYASANGGSASITADGRFVAVVSTADLAAEDANRIQDVYVLDRETRTITLETSSSDGGSSNGTSGHPDLSADGRYVVFESTATNLTAARDRNQVDDIFLRDRLTKTTRRLSVGINGAEANGRSEAPVISDDGRVVAFVSCATNLVAEQDRNDIASDVYVIRVETGEITRIGVNQQGKQFATSYSPALSSNGTVVAFAARESNSPNTAGVARPTSIAVYVRDLASGVTTCVSCPRTTTDECLPGFAPDISSDGRIVTFMVQRAAREARTDIAVHDRSDGTTTVITQHANARSGSPRISGNGRFVVFQSWASDLQCAKRCSASDVDNNILPDIYLFDRSTAQFRRVSGDQKVWWAPSTSPSIDGRGVTVTFSSRQPFGPEDATVDFDLYVCEPACQ
jgi:Tol biopolymer transport system component